MMTFQERFAEIDATQPLTDAQVFDAMAAAVVGTAQSWGHTVFLACEDTLRRPEFNASDELQSWVINVAGATALNLVARVEQIAETMQATSEQRAEMICETLASYRATIDTLFRAMPQGGSA